MSHTARPTSRLTQCLIALLAVMGTRCGSIDPPPPVDDEGETIEVPPPLEDWLYVSAIRPGLNEQKTRSLEPAFLIQFNQYLQEDTAPSYGVVSLRTGGLGVGGSYRPIMVDRALLWRPYAPLEDGFEYTLRVDGAGLYSVSGAPTSPDYMATITFRANATHEEEALDVLDEEPVRWPRVEALFASRGCSTCHGDKARWPNLSPLDPEHLIGARAEESELSLVRRNDPTRSYLMHKLLPDSPLRRGATHPPEWDAASRALTREELWLIEQWIRQGATR